jgi:hypothetical protein
VVQWRLPLQFQSSSFLPGKIFFPSFVPFPSDETTPDTSDATGRFLP